MDPVLLIFIALTLVIVFKLISVLGTRTGHEQNPELEPGDVAQRATHTDEAQGDADIDHHHGQDDADTPTPVKPVSAIAARLQAADPAFDERTFIDGARGAYEMIVEAFAAGDLKNIRPYLDQAVFESFRTAVEARSAAGQTVDLKFVGIDKATLADADAENGRMRAEVEFLSNQVRTVYASDGEIVDGNPNRIDLVRDRWTFERPINARDPNWLLVATDGGA